MRSRRELLRGASILSGGTLISGCLSTGSSTETHKTQTSKLGTETTEQTPEETTKQDTSTSTEPSDLELINTTNSSRTLVLEVQPGGGTARMESWGIDSRSTVEISEYSPLDGSAQLTANVENYQPTTHDWTGDEPGKVLRITITEDEITMRVMIN